jgi:hypothetical protein
MSEEKAAIHSQYRLGHAKRRKRMTSDEGLCLKETVLNP